MSSSGFGGGGGRPFFGILNIEFRLRLHRTNDHASLMVRPGVSCLAQPRSENNSQQGLDSVKMFSVEQQLEWLEPF